MYYDFQFSHDERITFFLFVLGVRNILVIDKITNNITKTNPNEKKKNSREEAVLCERRDCLTTDDKSQIVVFRLTTCLQDFLKKHSLHFLIVLFQTSNNKYFEYFQFRS
jgi:hypothetical protein